MGVLAHGRRRSPATTGPATWEYSAWRLGSAGQSIDAGDQALDVELLTTAAAIAGDNRAGDVELP